MQLLTVFICGLVCLSAVYAEPVPIKDIEEITKSCITKTEVDVAHLEDLQKGKLNVDEKLHCFAACVFQETGMLDENGDFQEKIIFESLPKGLSQEDAIKFFQLCSTKKGENACETAGLTLRCFVENKVFEAFPLKTE